MKTQNVQNNCLLEDVYGLGTAPSQQQLDNIHNMVIYI